LIPGRFWPLKPVQGGEVEEGHATARTFAVVQSQDGTGRGARQ
jgi:hypothetical protein